MGIGIVICLLVHFVTFNMYKQWRRLPVRRPSFSDSSSGGNNNRPLEDSETETDDSIGPLPPGPPTDLRIS